MLMLQRPGEAYAIWVFWYGAERAFRGWYVNLQEPFRRNGRGYDTQDLELDIVVPVDGPWEWKDDELLDVRVAEGRFTPEQAAAARAKAAASARCSTPASAGGTTAGRRGARRTAGMWASGELVTLRYRSIDGRFHSGRPVRVIEHTPERVVTYMPEGTIVSMPVLADGRGLRDVPLHERGRTRASRARRPWHGDRGDPALPERARALALGRARRRALAARLVRQPGGSCTMLGARTISTRDHVLDIWVPAETGEPQWKDEDELAARVEAGRFTRGRGCVDPRRRRARLGASGRGRPAGRSGSRRPSGRGPSCPTAGTRTDGDEGETVPDAARVRHARALLGRVGVGAARRAAGDRRLEGCARHRAALRRARLDPVDALHRRACCRPLRQPRGRGLRRRLSPRRRRCPVLRARCRCSRWRCSSRAARRAHSTSASTRTRAALEAESGRRIMPMAHGLYSVGILVGAVGAGLARSAGAHRETILLGRRGADRDHSGPARHRAHRAGAERRTHTIHIERALLGLGILCAVAFVVEGGIESWSALFLERELDASPAVSGLGPGVFGASMASGASTARARGSASGRCSSAAGCSRPAAASSRRSRRARRSRSSGSRSAARASRCTRRSSSAPAAGAARARSRR